MIAAASFLCAHFLLQELQAVFSFTTVSGEIKSVNRYMGPQKLLISSHENYFGSVNAVIQAFEGGLGSRCPLLSPKNCF